MPTDRYRHLEAPEIVATADALKRRILERFPDSGLGQLSIEFCQVAETASARAARIRRPHWKLRALTGLAVVLLIGLLVAVELLTEDASESAGRQFGIGISSFAEFLQTLEASLGALVFLGAAVIFALSLESRSKRRQSLSALHELRSMAHIVDMHQLTKDPERSDKDWVNTASSPTVSLTPFELERYFDYCSEMLSLISKVAATYCQHLPDPVVVNAVDEIEALTTGLAQKIWQKIVLVDRLRHRGD